MLIPSEHRDRGICSCLSVAQAFLPVPKVTRGTIAVTCNTRASVLLAFSFSAVGARHAVPEDATISVTHTCTMQDARGFSLLRISQRSPRKTIRCHALLIGPALPMPHSGTSLSCLPTVAGRAPTETTLQPYGAAAVAFQ